MEAAPVLGGEVHQARDYQLEMLKLSLKRNIIVAVRFYILKPSHCLTEPFRWILGVERRRCTPPFPYSFENEA